MRIILFILLICFQIGCEKNQKTMGNKTNIPPSMMYIQPKMDKDQVLNILGAPKNRQFEGEWEKWVYYYPDMPGGKLFIIYFYKELVGETWESVSDSPR